MFVLSFISIDLELRSVKDTSIYETFELKVFKNMKFLGEVSNN